MKVIITSLLLTFFQPVFAQAEKQSTNLKTVVTGANQALSQVNTSTNSPVNQCGSLMHFSTDNCGSRVPASYWNEFKFNFNENNSSDDFTQAVKMNNYIESLTGIDEDAKNEMKKVFIKIKEDAKNFQSIAIYSDYLKNGNEKEFNEKLLKAGFTSDELKNIKSNFENSPIGKNLKVVSDYGISFDSRKGWVNNHSPKKGYLSPKAINENKELKNSLAELLGEEKVKELTDLKRTNAVNVGNLVFTPPNNNESMATYTKEEWQKKIQDHLDIYYREIKDSSEAIPKLGTMWDGWKLHSSRSHLKIVQAQNDRFNLASVEVDALRKMGFPQEETLKLDQQIMRMSQASADTVNDVYSEAEGMRKKLYGVAAGAAFAATPYGQSLLLENLVGGMSYLTAAGLALPYVQNAVNAGINVSTNGGSFWCQYSKTLASSAADSALNTITFNVIPVPGGAGNTIRSIEALMKIGKQALKYIKQGQKGWEISGRAYDCYNASQLFKDAEEEVNFYSEIGDYKAINELKLQAEETHDQMLKTCTELAFTGIKLGISSLDSKIKKAQEKREDENFKKGMLEKDNINPKSISIKDMKAPTFSEGKTFYKSTNGNSYEVKIVPSENGGNKVFFLSGDRKNKFGSMSEENLEQLRLQGRLMTVKASN